MKFYKEVENLSQCYTTDESHSPISAVLLMTLTQLELFLAGETHPFYLAGLSARTCLFDRCILSPFLLIQMLL